MRGSTRTLLRRCNLRVVAATLLAGLVGTALSSAPDAGADTRYHGSVARLALNRPIVDMAAAPGGNGYWLVAADGGIFSFGDARFHGSTGGMRLNQPIVGMSATPTGNGYWLVAADGGIFSFGDARFHGSTGGLRLAAPIVGIAANPNGPGYWTVGTDGGVFAFGAAPFHGSAGGRLARANVVGIAAVPRGGGYWMVTELGQVLAFGQARNLGSPQTATQPVTDIAPSRSGGYWIATQLGAVHVATERGVFLVDPELTTWAPHEAIATETHARINHERAARGLAPVAWDPQLAGAASHWANVLADSRAFGHQDLGGLLRAPGFAGRYAYLAENIYRGTAAAADSGSAHRSLMESASHRATILTPELQYVGVGVACRGGEVWLVEDFGIATGSPQPPERPIPPLNPFVSDDDAGTACS